MMGYFAPFREKHVESIEVKRSMFEDEEVLNLIAEAVIVMRRQDSVLRKWRFCL